ncbi:MAG: Formimidoylglutamate deiminase [Acidobacteria bacterium]|nr:Formimidoylglutamate deiminase [Acidobacteriota bacterium]
MSGRAIIEAELTWRNGRFVRGEQVIIEDGLITEVGALGLEPTQRLTGQALLPGFISAHSHAFQRALRGRGETFPAGSGSFWSWREAMYALVAQLDSERFYAAVHATFAEMLAAGITSVGEFHYLHHSPAGNDFAFDELVLRAARDAGIRIVLLVTYYKTGGIGQALSEAQQRFATESQETFWRHVDALASKLDSRTQSLGVAAHSIRGVPVDEIPQLYAEARKRGMPFHMHVEEQRREIEESRNAYGETPMQLLLHRMRDFTGFTAVHATHSEPAYLQEFLARGGSVCITPLTEANLGDGIPSIAPLLARPDRLSLGSDSNARISMIEEMRWLEYAQRLRSETRGVYRDEEGRNAPRLIEYATLAGARSLGLDAGRIEPGAVADFVSIDLHARAIAEVSEEQLAEAIVFGAGDDVVHATCVAGEWR